MRCSALVIAFANVGCPVDVALKTADSVPRAVSEASRKHDVAPWAGRYYFTECAPNAPQPTCWVYDVVVDSDGMATVRADGPQVSTHVRSEPEVDDGFLLLKFQSYIDGNPDPPVHLPFSGREGFNAGALLATIGHDRAGHWCLVFKELQSPLRSRVVCGQ
jgi:hypothetical protein